MRQIPVDVSKLQVLAGGKATPLLGQDGQPKHDRDGRPLFVLPVITLAEGETPEVFNVRVPGTVPEVATLTPVRINGLVARPWSMGDRSGVTFTCASVQTVPRTQ